MSIKNIYTPPRNDQKTQLRKKKYWVELLKKMPDIREDKMERAKLAKSPTLRELSKKIWESEKF
jgi:hypothetical protein